MAGGVPSAKNTRQFPGFAAPWMENSPRTPVIVYPSFGCAAHGAAETLDGRGPGLHLDAGESRDRKCRQDPEDYNHRDQLKLPLQMGAGVHRKMSLVFKIPASMVIERGVAAGPSATVMVCTPGSIAK